MALAERYGVNRHTVRSAISALVQEGVLRAEQGRGTFVDFTVEENLTLGAYAVRSGRQIKSDMDDWFAVDYPLRDPRRWEASQVDAGGV